MLYSDEHAARYGLHEAILIQWFAEQIDAEGEEQADGRRWVRRPGRAILAAFPYIKRSQLEKALNRLVMAGAIHQEWKWNPESLDRTYWYALGESVAPVAGMPSRDSQEMGKSENGEIGKSAPSPLVPPSPLSPGPPIPTPPYNPPNPESTPLRGGAANGADPGGVTAEPERRGYQAAIFQAFEQGGGVIINHGEAAKAAQRLNELGYTAEQVLWATPQVLADDLLRKKPVNLWTVAKYLPRLLEADADGGDLTWLDRTLEAVLEHLQRVYRRRHKIKAIVNKDDRQALAEQLVTYHREFGWEGDDLVQRGCELVEAYVAFEDGFVEKRMHLLRYLPSREAILRAQLVARAAA